MCTCCYNKPFTDVGVNEEIPHMFNATSWTEKGQKVPKDFFPKIQELSDGSKINLDILKDKNLINTEEKNGKTG